MSILIVLLRNKTVTKGITIGFAFLHIWFTIYCWTNLGKTELSYFTYTSVGVLLLSALSVLTIPTVYHGFIYASKDDTKKI